MLAAALLIILSVIRLDLVKGQYTEDNYLNKQLLEDKDDGILPTEYIPVQSLQEQKFVAGLINEAGRHVLFPELYVSKEQKDEGKFEFYEIKGQPEIEESYMNERARRGGQDCPEHCPLYKPVCGSDGKVYGSECQMRKENCGRSDVTLDDWQKCLGKHYLCPSRCLDINDPVCGTDGRIYHNICVMRKRNCGKLINVLPVRKCYENVRQSKDVTVCPEDCQEVYKPVCGSDGVIYYNECFMKKRTCRSGIVEVDMEACAFVPKCPEICLPIYDPVCGEDRKLYINHCRMLQENCGKEIKVIARSYCGYLGRETASPARQVKLQAE